MLSPSTNLTGRLNFQIDSAVKGSPLDLCSPTLSDMGVATSRSNVVYQFTDFMSPERSSITAAEVTHNNSNL